MKPLLTNIFSSGLAKLSIDVVVTCAVLLTGCSNGDVPVSKTQTNVDAAKDVLADLRLEVEKWQCPAPVGGEDIRPLYYLKGDDKVHIKEARERIELKRRELKSNWETAENEFRYDQMPFAQDFYNTDEDKTAALLALRQAGDGVFPWAGTPQEYVRHKKTLYDGECKRRTKVIKAMLADKPKLAALRKEAYQPWLQERNRVTCFLAAVSNCRQ